ncbi:MAG: methyltransferase [Pseudomonadota bacterium]
MTKLFLTTALAAIALVGATTAAPAKDAKRTHTSGRFMLDLNRAVASDNRPTEDKARDAVRKPAELLALLDLKPGAKVADFIMGGGYWTRILSNAVGPTGKVYAYQPGEFIQFRAAYGTEQDAAVAGRANVVAQRDSLRAVAWPEPLDAIVTVQNWHDLHLNIVPPAFAGDVAKRLFAALKPGGVLLVVDHVGAAGQADSLHRGDPAGTKAEIEAAGFKLDGESKLYANAGDPHTALVFTMRGKTDQFVYRFRKPR